MFVVVNSENHDLDKLNAPAVQDQNFDFTHFLCLYDQ